MSSRFVLAPLVLAVFAAAPFALLACAEDDSVAQGEEDEIRARGAFEGDACSPTRQCMVGLVCKKASSGPPPGAVGLPLPPSARPQGPPPGAVGLPMPPNDGNGTCQQPANGEQGGTCSASIPCNAGLECDYTFARSSAPPRGAVGLPGPRRGTCRAASSGPPPGAVGLPMPPPNN